MLMTPLCLLRIVFFFHATSVDCCSLSSFPIPLVRTCHTIALLLYKYIYLYICIKAYMLSVFDRSSLPPVLNSITWLHSDTR